MSEIIQNQEDILVLNQDIIAQLKSLAHNSSRKRSRLLMHKTQNHLTQEMLICFYQNSYMPPHRHLKEKSESYHIVSGEMLLCIFDDEGQVLRKIKMSADGNFLYRVSEGHWHMPICLSEYLLYHEVFTGPFQKELDVEFPDWAPREDEHEKAQQFIKQLLQ